MSSGTKWFQTGAGTISAVCALLMGCTPPSTGRAIQGIDSDDKVDETLVWMETANKALLTTTLSSQHAARLEATLAVAIFDAHNGVERRFAPIHEDETAPRGASRRGAVVGAAYRVLSTMIPSQAAAFTTQYNASIAVLNDSDPDDDGLGRSLRDGLAWGDHVASDVLAWRASDGFSAPIAPFTGGSAVGQWRSTSSPAASMGVQQQAFMTPIVIPDSTSFRPAPPRGLASADWESDYLTVQALGAKTGSTRTQAQTEIAFIYNGMASVEWNETAIQLARAHNNTRSQNARLFALLNVSIYDSSLAIWNSKRNYAGDPTLVTWRPITAIRLGDTDGNPNTVKNATWTPLITTPNHPEYGAGHPGNNGAAAGLLQGFFGDEQAASFRVSAQYAPGMPTPPGIADRVYTRISDQETDGNDARVFGGMHYPSSNAASAAAGHAVATYVLANAAQPVNGAKTGQLHAHGDHGGCYGDGEVPNDDPNNEAPPEL